MSCTGSGRTVHVLYLEHKVSYFDINVCMIRKFMAIYQCFLYNYFTDGNLLHVYFYPIYHDNISRSYNICHMNDTSIIFERLSDICYRELYNPCAYRVFSYNTRILSTNVTKSVVNIIPMNRFEPQMSEHLAMDWNDLIYNIGGTVGMWLGVSMLSIPKSVGIVFMIWFKIFKIMKMRIKGIIFNNN